MSLYTELGGDQAIAMAIDRFYEKVLADPRVAKYFEGVDVRRVKAHQRAFLAMAFGGPNAYAGRDLRSAHEKPRAMGLDDEDTETFLGHFRATLEELGVGAEQVGEVMAIAYGGKDDVLGR